MTSQARALRYMMLSGDPALADAAVARLRPTLDAHHGRVGLVIAELGIPRTTFWRWMRESPALQAAVEQARSQASETNQQSAAA